MIEERERGTYIAIGANEMTVLLSREETDGAFSVSEYVVPPDGSAPPVHRHERTTEVFHVLDGTFEYTVDGDSHEATAGRTVVIWPGTPHTFAVPESAPVRLLLFIAPASLEGYFRDLGRYEEVLRPPPIDMDRLGDAAVSLCESYDQTIVDPEDTE